MFDFHEKRKIRKVVYSRFFIAGLFIITAVIMMSAYERFRIEREMAAKLELRTLELEALSTRATSLEERVEHMQNERGIEEELRTRFDVAREGEQVVVILDEQDSSKSATTAEDSRLEQPSFFERLKFW